MSHGAAAAAPLGLFAGHGVELEYMIVDRESLDVRPVCDALLRAACGAPESEIERGALAWSNELALHVLEIKTNGPAPALEGLAEAFQREVDAAHALLAPLGARLMPGAMHPWMDPDRETRLWPHEYGAVYRAFDRIFGCRGHGWSNVQSAHLNLPFAGDEEFARLHAALRLLLPLLPALAASSPVVAGRPTGLLDTRLDFYRGHAARIPAVVGGVIPEAVASRAEYETGILGPIYAALAPLDPEGVLRHEWVNARGAIARFDRGSIEVRVVDVQECPAADLAIAAATTAAARALAEGRLSDPERQRRAPGGPLRTLLTATLREGEEARVEDPELLALLGFPGAGSPRAGEVWRHLVESTLAPPPGGRAKPEEPAAPGAASGSGPARATERAAPEFEPALRVILDEGCLARRLLRRLGPDPDRERLASVWRELCDCLMRGEMLRAPA